MKNQQNDNYTKGFVVGALIGGLAGAITALLFAPKSGKELRADIAEKSGDIYDKSKDYLHTAGTAVAEKAGKYYDDGKEKASRLIEGAEKIYTEAKNKTIDITENVVDKFGTIRDAAKAGAETFKAEMKKSGE